MTSLIAALLLAAAPEMHPCIADAQKACPGVEVGHGAVLECLKAHPEAVSPACQQHMSTLQEDADACKADVQKLCPNSTPGPDRRQCMRAHKDQVSPQCKQLMRKVREHMQEQGGGSPFAACKPDAEKFCASVEKGGGRIIECLKSHQSELAPACSATLSAGRPPPPPPGQ